MFNYGSSFTRKITSAKRTTVVLLALTGVVILVTLQLTNITDDLSFEGFGLGPFLNQKTGGSGGTRPSYGGGLNDNQLEVLVSDFPASRKLIIFPTSFEAQDLQYEYQTKFGTLQASAEVFRFNQKKNYLAIPHSKQIFEQSNFLNYNLKLFHSFTNIENTDQCDVLRKDISVDASPATEISNRIADILEKFRLDNSQYYQDLKPLIGDEIDQQLAKGTVEEYWFKLAGSSVWLEQYGVHYMISRLLYSREQVRNVPFISLIYVQLFDENWNELRDVHLILPTNDPSKLKSNEEGDNRIRYKEVKFPDFLPVAHYINDKYKFYGPEDPRILLIRNKLGYEEPLIVFNANHRKIGAMDDDGEGSSTLRWDHFRSMFMCWPWQFQMGKVNVDGMSDNRYDYTLYNRVHEIRRKSVNRVATQKNWTPFLDYQERVENGNSDEFIYFVYRWSDMEILKCHLTDLVFDLPLQCEFVYRMNPELSMDEGVGAMRGGTELVNIRQLFKENYLNGVTQLKDLVNRLPHDRGIWIGFARAHLKYCGCGTDMYRPNLVVVTRNRKKYKVHSVSSFFSLGVESIGWDLKKPWAKCEDGPNVYIPNGISSWYVRQSSEDGDLHDYMTMSFSLSDYTCHIIHIRGLLTALLNMDSSFSDKLFELSSQHTEDYGYNNNNLDCAIRKSEEFCSAYGQNFEKEVSGVDLGQEETAVETSNPEDALVTGQPDPSKPPTVAGNPEESLHNTDPVPPAEPIPANALQPENPGAEPF